MNNVTQVLRGIRERLAACSSAKPENITDMLGDWERWSGESMAPDSVERQQVFRQIVGNSRDTNSCKARRLEKLRILDLSHNQLTSLPTLNEQLLSLDISYNHLASLPELSTKLHTLDASNNRLTDHSQLNQELRILDVSHNRLTHLPALNTKLRKLEASNNQLATLPELNENLHSFNVSNNQLKKLPALPRKMHSVNISHNQFTTLTKLNDELCFLDASCNDLISIPALNAKLRTLRADDNRLLRLPECNENLYTLNASHNLLVALPAPNEKLHALYASSNRLAALPQLNDELSTLDVRNNQLAILPELNEKLKRLDASHNRLTNLPELNASLKILYAYHNQLRSLPKLNGNLCILDASHNQLRTLPECNDQLRILNVSNNQLTDLPELNDKMYTLNVSHNLLRKVPLALLQGNRMFEADLRNNPIPRRNIAGFMAIIQQRRDRGEVTPTFIFDEELPINPQDLRNLTDTNVHNRRLVSVFHAQLDPLIKRYPHLIPPQDPFYFEHLQTTLFNDLQTCADRYSELHSSEFGLHSIAELAKTAITSMCNQGKEKTTAVDFDKSAGHVLAYVHHYIKDQSADQQDVGLLQLFQHLSYACGNNEQMQVYCPTRHIEEALSALQSAYTMEAGVSFEQARDLMHQLGKKTLASMKSHVRTHDLFTQRLRDALREHPNIKTEQIERYLHEFVLPHWETYCDVAQE